MKIIIADDHFIVRKGLINIIKETYSFAKITEAPDATELVKHLMKSSFDIVITDLSMPGQSGIEIVKQIKEIAPQTPLLVLSTYPPEQFAVRAIKSGASGYLNKESSFSELVNAIDTLLNSKKYITPEVATLLADAYSGDIKGKEHESLSDREFEVLKLISQGKTVTEVAEYLSLSTNTISTYRARILEKLNLHSTTDIIKYALEKGIA
ncbi:MAG: response regulator transcription factor [Bacteroidetes bacterium]|nr:response regulator transcription factor [Bacteroidota bacterium]MBS1648719.1 response regulator transcription factor [Bacteroidota bacterium]